MINTNLDKITMTGAALGIVSLFFPIITLKPNRVDDGTPLSWIQSGGVFPFVIISILLICLIVSALYFKKDQNIFGKVIVVLFKAHYRVRGIVLAY